uniref:TGF-beta ligand n=1 Tax=Mnemiopsis leidyi TaxID=27923 RepID=G5CTK8_MNELE|nr:TGF-beta ligand [Mnemiopsis leidyi]
MSNLLRSCRTMLCSFIFFIYNLSHHSCSSDNEVSAPDYLMELYHKFNQGIGQVEEEEENANKIFTFYRSGVTEWEDFYLPQRSRLDFNISAFNKEDKILASNLRVFVDDISEIRPLPKDWPVTALTLKTTCKTRVYQRETNQLLVQGRIWRHTKQLKQSDTGQWIKIKVSSIGRTLNNLSQYRHFYNFVVRCSISTTLSPGYHDKYGGRTPILSISRSREPTLVVYTVNNSTQPFKEVMRSNQVSRAAVRDEDEGVSASRGFQHRCTMMEFYVNFTKLGWGSKIIHPQIEKINQCAGQCPYPMSHAIDHTTNALFRGAWSKQFPGSVARPCCVPAEYKPATLMLMQGPVTILKIFDDLIITKCKCL